MLKKIIRLSVILLMLATIAMTVGCNGSTTSGSDDNTPLPTLSSTTAFGSQDNSDNSSSVNSSNNSNNGSTNNQERSHMTPEGSEAIGENIFYYELYELQSDPGDGLTPKQGAELLVTDVLVDTGILDYLDPSAPDKCIYIAFDDLEQLAISSEDGRECYIYSIATGIISDDIMGNFFEVESRAYVEYETGYGGLFDDDGSYYMDNDSNSRGNPSEPEMPGWEGRYIGSNYVIEIYGLDEDGLRFAVLDAANMQSGDFIIDAAAAFDPGNSQLVVSGDMEIYMDDDFNAVDFLVNESSEWGYLRGVYERLYTFEADDYISFGE
jgi:hypothetical protein